MRQFTIDANGNQMKMSKGVERMKKKVVWYLYGAMFVLAFCGCGSKMDNVEVVESEIATKAETVQETVTENKEEEKIIVPLASTVDMDNLDNCTVAVSFDEGDIYVDDAGVMQIRATVYDYDVYDMVDISEMKKGDTIEVRNENVLITSLEKNELGLIMINGGIENGGFDLYTNENGVYYESGFSDIKSFYELGEVTLPVSDELEFYDSSDFEKGEQTYYAGDFLTESAGLEYYFVPDNTSIVIEDGIVTKMYRVFMP